MQKSNKLRFAVMCDGTHLAKWQAKCIRELIASELAEPALLIQPAHTETKADLFKRFKSQVNKLPFYIYNLFWVKRRSKAHQSEDCNDILGNLPVVTCATEKIGKYRERFSNEDISHIAAMKLDFILRFAFNIIEGDILSSAKYGVWSFHHGDERKYRGAPPGFWECYSGDPSTGVILQRLTESLDAGHILYRGTYDTHRSYTRNIEQIHMRATNYPVSVCKGIIAGNTLPPISSSSAKIYKAPGTLQMLAYGAKRLYRLLRFSS